MIMPTVGRVLWYRPSLFDDVISEPHNQPLAAIVAHVHNSRLVNLVVFDMHGNSFPKQGIQLVQEGDEAPQSQSYCHWMPFQLGQAKSQTYTASGGGGGRAA